MLSLAKVSVNLKLIQMSLMLENSDLPRQIKILNANSSEDIEIDSVLINSRLTSGKTRQLDSFLTDLWLLMSVST